MALIDAKLHSNAILLLPAMIVKLIVPLLLLLTFLSACGSGTGDRPPNKANIPANAPDRESWNTTILLSDSTWTRARIQIGRARQYQGRLETLLDSGVIARFYAQDGGLNATLVSDSARIDDRTKNMTAYGRVHAVSIKRRIVVTTDTLHFDNAGRRFYSNAPVRVVDSVRHWVIEGVGFQSDEAMTNYSITKIIGKVNQGEE